jgi:hypothetical protein
MRLHARHCDWITLLRVKPVRQRGDSPAHLFFCAGARLAREPGKLGFATPAQ